jgi:hypothetical protein
VNALVHCCGVRAGAQGRLCALRVARDTARDTAQDARTVSAAMRAPNRQWCGGAHVLATTSVTRLPGRPFCAAPLWRGTPRRSCETFRRVSTYDIIDISPRPHPRITSARVRRESVPRGIARAERAHSKHSSKMYSFRVPFRFSEMREGFARGGSRGGAARDRERFVTCDRVVAGPRVQRVRERSCSESCSGVGTGGWRPRGHTGHLSPLFGLQHCA